jgi:hypothetical protein
MIFKNRRQHIMATKICSDCKVEKDINMFHKDKNKKDGHKYICKQCITNKRKKPEDVINIPIITKKVCRRCNIEKDVSLFNKDKEQKDGYRYMCKDCMREYRNTPEEIQKRVVYREETKDNWREWYNSSEVKERRIQNKIAYRPKAMENFLRKYHTDIEFKLKITLREQLRRVVKGIDTSYYELLGCNYDYFMRWIEFRFDNEMNWDNYGTVWEIDHIIPLSQFNLMDENERKICAHWSNLQPLTVHENRKKNNKIYHHQIFNNVVNVCRFNKKYNQFLGYQVINESLLWLKNKEFR